MTTGQPLALSAEGATREEALQELQQVLKNRLSSGAEIVPFELSSSENPLTTYAGMFKNNPLFEAWQRAIADNRQADDEAENS